MLKGEALSFCICLYCAEKIFASPEEQELGDKGVTIDMS